MKMIMLQKRIKEQVHIIMVRKVKNNTMDFSFFEDPEIWSESYASKKEADARCKLLCTDFCMRHSPGRFTQLMHPHNMMALRKFSIEDIERMMLLAYPQYGLFRPWGTKDRELCLKAWKSFWKNNSLPRPYFVHSSGVIEPKPDKKKKVEEKREITIV